MKRSLAGVRLMLTIAFIAWGILVLETKIAGYLYDSPYQTPRPPYVAVFSSHFDGQASWSVVQSLLSQIVQLVSTAN